MKPAIKIDVNDVIKDLIITIDVIGLGELKIKIFLVELLLQLAGIILGCKFEISETSFGGHDPDGVNSKRLS